MGYLDMVFLAVVALLVGLIAWTYLGPKKRRRYDGSDDYGSHMRPERNDDAQVGGGID
jgi:hypothetical protein